MKRIRSFICVFLLTFLHYQLNAQSCGTEATSEQLKYMKKLVAHKKQFHNKSVKAPLVQIPIKIHIIRRSNGTDGLATDRITTLISQLNAAYAPAKMEFFVKGNINIINSDAFYNLDQSEENALAGVNDVSGAINIYFSGGLSAGTSPLCGYTRFPPSTDRVFVACANNPTTLIHEMGHYFTLFHTHGKTNTGSTDELVARVNCDILGDEICDTPADPNLTGVVNGNCVYTGGARDAQGVPFNPMVNNYMAYSLDQCQNAFTDGQYERIRNGFDEGRDYLDYNTPNFNARFSVDKRSGCAPLIVTFRDNTIGESSRRWEFEGANLTVSASEIVTITYNNPGAYKVRLIVENNLGIKDTITRNAYIEVNDVFQDVWEINANIQETFNTTSLPSKWRINNPDRITPFQYSNLNSNQDGSGSFFLNNFAYDAETGGQRDELFIPNYKLGEVSSAKLTFDYAYTYNLNPVTEISKTDTLKVGYQFDCDDKTTIIWQKGGAELATALATNQAFVPTISQWKNQEIDIDLSSISKIADYKVLKFLFQNISYNGNNLYIDNVKLTPSFLLFAPSFLKLDQPLAGGINLTWIDGSFNETGFKIERSINNQNFVEIARVGTNVNKFRDTDIDLAIPKYYYRIAALNSKATSNYSNILEVSSTVTSIEDFTSINQIFKIFPNPIHNEINFYIGEEVKENNITIEIVDLTGKKLQTQKILIDNRRPINFAIPITNISTGFYIVCFKVGELVVNRKIIIH